MADQRLNHILERRSIRNYTEQPVADHLIKELLHAAMCAPSACNQQPWHFIVIRDREVLRQIAAIHAGFQVLQGAPLAILVCGEPRAAVLEFFWQQDCAAATENILIAAQASGLGAVWLGIHPDGGEDADQIRKLVQLPSFIQPFALVSAGYPAEQKAPSERFKEERVHFQNYW